MVICRICHTTSEFLFLACSCFVSRVFYVWIALWILTLAWTVIELAEKYRGQTCGLCGNYNGNKNDDISENGPATWKVSTPTESCEDVILPPRDQCDQASVCQQYLSSPGFSDCYNVMDMGSFEKACVDDLCQCYGNHDCLCNTLTEISRQCTHAGGKPGTWRTEQLCHIKCTGDQIFLPCGPSEPPTCRDGPIQSTISVLTEGCFCPENTTGLCVPKCGCIDPSGTPREFGELFKYKCEDCVCEKARQSVICKPKKCPDVNPVSCTEPGFMLFNVTDPSDPCCSKQVCNLDCAVSMCPDGSCTQESCIYDASDKTKHVLKDREKYNYKCETVTCREMNGVVAFL